MLAWRNLQAALGIGLLLLASAVLLRGKSGEPAENRPAAAAQEARERALRHPSKSGPREASKSDRLQRLIQSGQIVKNSDGGWLIRDAPLHEILRILARQAGLNYDHNQNIEGDKYRVNGLLTEGDPLQQMEMMAFMYGASLYIKDNTICPFGEGGKLPYPDIEITYELKHIRNAKAEDIHDLLKPMMSETGTLRYDPLTRVITAMDDPIKVGHMKNLLEKIDQPKAEITVEVQVVNVSKSDAIDLSANLGEFGDQQGRARNLNSVLGLENEPLAEGDGRATRQVLFDQSQINEVLRTLGNRGQIERVSNETLTTPDNELATNSFNYGNSRENGATIAMAPTLLPDETIRMRVRAVDLPAVDDANQAPVWKQEMSSLARIPPGQSLVVGGLLEGNKEGDNLVMVITPTYTLPEGMSLHPDPEPVQPRLGPVPRFLPSKP